MNTKRLFGMLWVFLCAVSFISCGDDELKSDPAGTITLSMVNEDHGATLLGESRVYLDKVNNFVGKNIAFITDLGSLSGLGHVDDVKVLPVAQQVAATVGHGYWVYAQETIMEFPSHAKAFRIDDTYYKVYVESMLEENKGVKIKYIPVTIPNDHGLPEPGSDIGSFRWSYRLEVDVTSFEDGLEYAIYPLGYAGNFRCYLEDVDKEGVTKRYLYVEQISNLESRETVSLYMRLGEVYSFVHFTAN